VFSVVIGVPPGEASPLLEIEGHGSVAFKCTYPSKLTRYGVEQMKLAAGQVSSINQSCVHPTSVRVM
jgi:hypothetical protein